MTTSHKSQVNKPTQYELVKNWLLAGEKLDVMSVRVRTGNYGFHLCGRINELRKNGFVIDDEYVPVKEGSGYKIFYINAEFLANVQKMGLVDACFAEKQRRAMEKEFKDWGAKNEF